MGALIHLELVAMDELVVRSVSLGRQSSQLFFGADLRAQAGWQLLRCCLRQ